MVQLTGQPAQGHRGLAGKKAVMVIAEKNFRDEEFLQPKEILEKAGVMVSVASSNIKSARGTLGAVVAPDNTMIIWRPRL